MRERYLVLFFEREVGGRGMRKEEEGEGSWHT